MKIIKIKKDLIIRLFHYVNNIRNSEMNFREVFDNCPKDVKDCADCGGCAYRYQCHRVGVVVSEINLNK